MARLPVRSLIKGVYKNSDGSADSVNSLHDVIKLGQVVRACRDSEALAPVSQRDRARTLGGANGGVAQMFFRDRTNV